MAKLAAVFSFLTIFVFALVFYVMPVFATIVPPTRYVATTGADSGDCTGSPCLTIQYAIGQANPGDTIQVAAGTYTEDIIIDKSLTLVGAGSTIQSVTTDGVVVRILANNVDISGFTIEGNHNANRCVANRNLANSYPQILFYYIHDNTIENCKIYGIDMRNSKGTITGNTIQGNGYTGVLVWGGPGGGFGGPTTVNTNVLSSNGGGAPGYDFDIWMIDTYGGDVVSHNTITGSGTGDEVCIVVHNRAGELATGGLTISDNTLADCKIGIAAWQDGSGAAQIVDVFRNTITGGTTAIQLSYNGGSFVQGRFVTIGDSLSNSNSISGYSSYALQLVNYVQNVDAEYNYWGVYSQSEIENKIWHNVDDGSLGTVDYDPWISASPESIGGTTTDNTVSIGDPIVDTSSIPGISSMNFGTLPGGTHSVDIIEYDTTPSPPPTGFQVLGRFYDINSDLADGTFSVTLVFTYTDGELAALGLDDTTDILQLYYYNAGTGLWVPIVGIVDPVANTITITVDHFTQFSIIAAMSVEGFDITLDWAKGPQTNIGILDLQFTNGGGAPDTVTQVKVRSQNTNDVTDVQWVKLWEDDGDAVFEPGTGDTLRGTQAFAGGVVTFAGLAVVVPAGGTKDLFVSYDTYSTAGNGNTLDAKINAGDITMTNSGTNVGALDPAGSATLDTIAPSVGITTAPGIYKGTINLGASATDGSSGVQKVEFYKGLPGGGTYLGEDATPSYVYSWVTTSLDDGTYTIWARGYDNVGNYQDVDTVTITVDNTKPVTVLDAVATPTAVNTFSVTGTSTDTPTNVVNVQWKYSTDVLWSATIPSDGAFNEPSEAFNFNVGPLADGTYTVNVRAADSAGNVEVPISAIFCIDTVSPVASIGGPYSGNEGSSIGLDASASYDPAPNCGAITIAWDLDNDGLYDDATGATTSNTWGADGGYTIGIKVTDAIGHISYASTIVTVNNVPPVINALGITSPINENDIATFTATVSDSGTDDATLNYDIEWGDGTANTTGSTGTGSISETHRYLDDDADDKYTVTLTVTDSDGATDVDTTEITVNNVNPVAFANGPYTRDEGQVIILTASATDVGTLDTLGYAWDLDSDGLYDDGPTQAVSYTCNPDGVYTVAVQITDDDGGTDTDSTTVTVSNVAPTITSIGSTTPIDEGSSTTFDAVATDPGSDDITLGYDINWGDAAHTTGTIASGATNTQTHVYGDNGVYTITYTVTDSDLATDSDTTAVTVNNVAPTVSAPADVAGNEGSLVTTDQTTFTDPGTDTFTATINWGDGNTDDLGAVTSPIASQSHTYTDNGVYTVTITVTDDDGGVGSDTLTATISNVAPTVVVTLPNGAEIWAGTNNVQWTVSDPSVVDTFTSAIEYSPDDGSSWTTVATGVATIQGANSYSWDTIGFADSAIALIRVTTTDDDLGSGSDDSDGVFMVDNTLPTISNIVFTPADPSNDNTPYITFDIDDDGSGVDTTAIQVSDGTNTYTTITAPAITCSGPVSGTYSCSITWSTLADGDYTFAFDGGDLAGNPAVQQTVAGYTVDTAKPTTSDDAPAGWQTAIFTVTLTESDPAPSSGIEWTEYCVDTTDMCVPDTVGTSIPFNTDGQYYLRYHSKDNAGNVQDVASRFVQLDTVAPTTTDDTDPTTPWYAADTAVTLTCNDATSGCADTYYCVDTDGSCSPVTLGTSVSVTCPSDSVCLQYVSYYSTDVAGNPEVTKTSNVIKIDKEKPTGYSLSVDGVVAPAEYMAGAVTVRCDGATDGTGSGVNVNTYDFEYSLDGSAWNPMPGCTDTVSSCSWDTSAITDDASSLRCRVDDSVANIGDWAQTDYAGIDNTEPTSAITYPADDEWLSSLVEGSPLTLTGTAADANSDVQKVDILTSDVGTWNQAIGTTSWAYSWPLPVDGHYAISSRATDNAKPSPNVESTYTTITVHVDSTPPTITGTAVSEGIVQSGTPVQITATITDNLAGVNPATVAANVQLPDENTVDTVSLVDDGTGCDAVPGDDNYCGVWTAAGTEGTYLIDVVAADNADNWHEDENGATVIVDNTPPVVHYVFSGDDWVGTGRTFYVDALVSDDTGFDTPTYCVVGIDDLSGLRTIESSILYSPTSPTTGKCSGYATVNDTFAAGSASLIAGIQDAAGNYGEQSALIGIDDISPSTPALEVSDDDGDGYDTDGTVTWHWTESSDEVSGIDYYWIDVDSPGWIHTKVFGTAYTVSDLSDGEWHATVRAVDKAGQESPESNEVSITVDTTKPTAVDIWAEDTEKGDKPLYYDTDGDYEVSWDGGDDNNFDEYQLFEDGATIYTDSDTSYEFEEKDDGAYKYYVKAVDEAGWETKSEEITVVVDTQPPNLDVSGPTGFLGMWTFNYTASDVGSGLEKIEVSDSDTPFVTCFGLESGWCMVLGGTYVELTAYDKAGNSATDDTSGAAKDTTPPTINYSAPSGVINDNNVMLHANTDEPATCYYGEEDDWESMAPMTGIDSIEHSADLGVLADGLYVYHVQCNDTAGNWMDSSKTIVFSVNTAGDYCYTSNLNSGWNTFFLPQLILDDINFNCGETPYATADVLASLDNNYEVIWYYDGSAWKSYSPLAPPWANNLHEFNDEISSPYYIKMGNADRLELMCDQQCD
jgi:parallel beta-helix repeat protein